MTNKLYIHGLLHGVTNEQIKKHFDPYGTVISAKVIINDDTGLSKGFGFVKMSTEEEAANAIKNLNNSVIDGSKITVKEARPL